MTEPHFTVRVPKDRALEAEHPPTQEPCGHVKKFHIAPTLEIAMKCAYTKHTNTFPHFASDVIEGVIVEYRWRK